MRVAWVFSGALAVALGLSCGGGGGVLSPTIHVDALAGDDVAGDGSAQRPFRTITHALQGAQPNDMVKVSPGTYDAAHGETFPIVVPAAVALSGDVATGGLGPPETRIAGAGPWSSAQLAQQIQAAIVTSPGALLEGLAVTATGGTAIWCEHAGAGASVRANSLKGSGTGVVVAGATNAEIRSNNLAGNDEGLATIGPAAPHVRDNTIEANRVGVFVGADSNPDLGTALDPGSNRLLGNSDCTLENRSGGTIDALGNVWDADPLTFAATTSCAAGAEVANTGTGAVLFQEIPASDAPLFGGSALLSVTSPSPGAVISTQQPRIVWQATGARYVMAVIATKEPVVRDRRIDNPGVLIWAWHTGLGQGAEGDVPYTEGVPVVSGQIQTSGPTAPLERGRAYYWAAWAWDDAGLRIESSTALAWFIVSN